MKNLYTVSQHFSADQIVEAVISSSIADKLSTVSQMPRLLLKEKRQRCTKELYVVYQEQQMLEGATKEQQRALLRDGWVVEHAHSFNAQQHSQTPCNHVVEDNGTSGARNKS